MLIGYARVSTHDQDCALQRDALTAAGCTKIFTETASGAERNRPRLKAAIRMMKSGDTLVVWRFDRLARTLAQLLQTEDKLRAGGMGLRSLTENLDLETPHGRLIFQIQGAVGEYELRQIQMRTKAGLKVARARGRQVGRKPLLSEINLKEIQNMLKNKPTRIHEVACHFGVSTSTLYRHLSKIGKTN